MSHNRSASRALSASLLLAVLAAVSVLAQPVSTGEPLAALIARIEGPQLPDRQGYDGLTIAELMQRLHVPGVSVAVIKDFEVHWAKAYGVADAESGRPVETTTPFQAASISKPVAAMAAMRLVQDGKLSLDADINTVLRSWHVPASEHTRTQPVTARSLMSHTSGADDGFGFPGYEPGAPRPTLVQILGGEGPSNVGKVLFVRPPYAGYKYSGGSVVLMQLAMQDITGRAFAEFMQSTVLGPIGMTDSSYEQPPGSQLAARAARAHDGQGKRGRAPFHVYPEQGAAGLWTTATDLARFLIDVQQAVRGPRGKVLEYAAAREMVSPVGTGPFAVGFTIAKDGEGWYFQHGGSNWGFRANIIGHVRKGYGLAIMTNSDSGGALGAEIQDRVAEAYNWDSLHKPIPR